MLYTHTVAKEPDLPATEDLPMRHSVAMLLMIGVAATALLCSAGEPPRQVGPEEKVLLEAGLNADPDSLLDFFRARIQPRADLEKMLTLARQLGDTDAKTRRQRGGQAGGRWAVGRARAALRCQ